MWTENLINSKPDTQEAKNAFFPRQMYNSTRSKYKENTYLRERQDEELI